MEKIEIRTLRADEIEVRAQQVSPNGAVLLLYKNARCDMAILDEVFTPFGWKREHKIVDRTSIIKGEPVTLSANYCTVSIWDKNTQQWVTKEDTGTESNTEAQKGESSDSFKRACFNVGIGRELYTAPFIWVNLGKGEIIERNGRYSIGYNVNFSVGEIEYKNRVISKLTIVDQNGTIRYEMKNSQSKSPEKKKSVLTLDQLYDDEKCQKLMVWLEAAEAKATKGGNKFDVESFVRERATVGTDCMDELVRTYDQYKQDKQQ